MKLKIWQRNGMFYRAEKIDLLIALEKTRCTEEDLRRRLGSSGFIFLEKALNGDWLSEREAWFTEKGLVPDSADVLPQSSPIAGLERGTLTGHKYLKVS